MIRVLLIFIVNSVCATNLIISRDSLQDIQLSKSDSGFYVQSINQKFKDRPCLNGDLLLKKSDSTIVVGYQYINFGYVVSSKNDVCFMFFRFRTEIEAVIKYTTYDEIVDRYLKQKIEQE